MSTIEQTIGAKYAALAPYLDERQRRWWLANEARALGRGGVSTVARATGRSRTTITKAVAELAQPPELSPPDERVRRRGAGRKRATEADPFLLEALETLIEPTTWGGPESALRWTLKSTRSLAAELTERGHTVSAWTVARLLRAAGYTLRGNAREGERGSEAERRAQFRYVLETAVGFLVDRQPVVSVGISKKLTDEDFDADRRLQPSMLPGQLRLEGLDDVEQDDLAVRNEERAVATARPVSIAADAHAAILTAESLRQWWNHRDRTAYQGATRLFVAADGGAAGPSNVLWLTELAKLASAIGLAITVCHVPAGTRRWSNVESRMYCQMSMYRHGARTISYEVTLETVAITPRPESDSAFDDEADPLRVGTAAGDYVTYTVSEHDARGDWNYTIHPTY